MAIKGQKGLRRAILTISVINGFTGLVCGALLMIRPDGALMGLGVVIPVLHRTPVLGDVFFRNLLWVGVVMFAGLGVPGTIAAALTLKKKDQQYHLQSLAGILLVFWCVAELFLLPNPAVLFYLVVGLFQVGAARYLVGKLRLWS